MVPQWDKINSQEKSQNKKKSIFCALPIGSDTRFRKFAYFPEDVEVVVILLHYLGDEEIVVDFLHGNLFK